MTLKRLKIEQFRNIKSADIYFSQTVNCFYGDNGSGKTSVLEALYHLSTFRSFRSHINDRIISHDADAFTLYAELLDQQTLGLQKGLKAPSQMKINGEKARSTSALARLNPMILLNYDSFELITGSSQFRRQFYDWLMFHVEHHFASYWRYYQRGLKQRNSALKKRGTDAEIHSWNQALSEYGEKITAIRQQYFELLVESAKYYLNILLPELSEISFSFDSGYDDKKSLTDILSENLQRDKARGYTQYGPHRADFHMTLNGRPVKDILSRGQQKALLFSLMLAKIGAYKICLPEKATPCVLLDDVAAELDQRLFKRIMTALFDFEAQIFMTLITIQGNPMVNFDHNKIKLFHVEHGTITEEIIKNA